MGASKYGSIPAAGLSLLDVAPIPWQIINQGHRIAILALQVLASDAAEGSALDNDSLERPGGIYGLESSQPRAAGDGGMQLPCSMRSRPPSGAEYLGTTCRTRNGTPHHEAHLVRVSPEPKLDPGSMSRSSSDRPSALAYAIIVWSSRKPISTGLQLRYIRGDVPLLTTSLIEQEPPRRIGDGRAWNARTRDKVRQRMA